MNDRPQPWNRQLPTHRLVSASGGCPQWPSVARRAVTGGWCSCDELVDNRGEGQPAELTSAMSVDLDDGGWVPKEAMMLPNEAAAEVGTCDKDADALLPLLRREPRHALSNARRGSKTTFAVRAASLVWLCLMQADTYLPLTRFLA